MAGTATQASAATGQDARYFLTTATASGQWKADYGEERLRPGQTTASGVDGSESGSWRWTMRAVGRAVGDGPIQSAAAEFKGVARHSADIVFYSIQAGHLDEDRQCEGDDVPPRRITTSSDRRRPARVRGDFVTDPESAVSFRRTGFEVEYPFRYDLLYPCFHGPPRAVGNEDETISFVGPVSPEEANVARGAFNPRFDRSFSNTWRDSVELTHGSSNDEHAESASSTFTIAVEAVSERKARRLRDKYRKGDPRAALMVDD